MYIYILERSLLIMSSRPPETTRDVIMAGARALEKGDWQKCEDYVLSLPVWTHLGSEECVSEVKATLRTRIKEEVASPHVICRSYTYIHARTHTYTHTHTHTGSPHLPLRVLGVL